MKSVFIQWTGEPEISEAVAVQDVFSGKQYRAFRCPQVVGSIVDAKASVFAAAAAGEELMTLTVEDRAQLIELLSLLQEHLEGAIESSIPRPIPDENPERMEVLMSAEIKDDYADCVQQDRIDWRKTEDWLIRLKATAPADKDSPAA